MFTSTGSNGLYKAPLSKSLLLVPSAISILLTLLFQHYQKFFAYNLQAIKEDFQIWRLICGRTICLDLKDTFCSSLLIYNFRIFERRYGSRKFSSFLLGAWMLSALFDLLLVELAQYIFGFTINSLPSGLSSDRSVKCILTCAVMKTNLCFNAAIYGSLTSIAADLWDNNKQDLLSFLKGDKISPLHRRINCLDSNEAKPFSDSIQGLEYLRAVFEKRQDKLLPQIKKSLGPVFALFVPFYCSIPRVQVTQVLGHFSITNKTLVYILGLQLLTSGSYIWILALSGLISGICYNSSILKVHQILCVPSWVAKIFSWTLEPIFSSAEPTNEIRVGMGATVDIQRQQRMELLDRQIMMSQVAQMRRQRQQQGGMINWNRLFPPLRHRHNANYQDHRLSDQETPPPTEVSEEQVARLMEMGFSRGDALEALRASNNDLNVATNFLLQH